MGVASSKQAQNAIGVASKQTRSAIGVASQKKTQSAQPRCARSQGPLARPTQNASVRIHGSGRHDE
jgi:hypothetical protein